MIHALLQMREVWTYPSEQFHLVQDRLPQESQALPDSPYHCHIRIIQKPDARKYLLRRPHGLSYNRHPSLQTLWRSYLLSLPLRIPH